MSIVISGMAVVSGLGNETADFVAGLPAARAGAHPVRVTEAGDDDFGTTRRVRLRERAAVLAVGALTKLAAGFDLSGVAPARRAIVLGSATAGFESYMVVAKGSLAGAKPYFVDHNRMPPAIMNYTTGQAAVKLELHGPNVTVTAGRASGLAALTCARRLAAAGRADVVLAGAFEEVTDRRLRIERATGRASGAVAGEGACLFAVQTAEAAARLGRPVLAELASTAAGFFTDPADAPETLARTVARALRLAGTDTARIGAVVRGAPGDGPLARHEQAVLATLAPGARVLDPAPAVGDTYGALSAFGVATAIVAGTTGDTLVTSMDPDGQVAAAVLRTPGSDA
ncbi:beta-ketoacyl synthase N-terminal-like domain-containing protein [Actinoplanes sp. G11-F43]|uniref:beta-ketoacyl synthase N-terminal-like domain-containing protein n=1 Tax=Actinoplanes sp. G11-F43 TaxID=3424130 RepID=UPI003D32F372